MRRLASGLDRLKARTEGSEEFAHLPEHLRWPARNALNRTIGKWKHEGRSLTPWRIALAHALAANLVLYPRDSTWGPMMPYPPNNWSLKVGGMVDRPMVFSLADLKRLPRTDMRVRHHCVEGWSAVASWHGVQLREIARMAGAHRDARYVEFRSFDAGYWSSWDRESALHPQSLLAYGMNGHDLYPDHGAPLRIYSPVKLGYKSVKYVTEVNFLPTRTGGYWENQGYEWYAGV
jgi:DMSO/TMAO reductase YedYZ molybdopterin-dependent catalytic subunit